MEQTSESIHRPVLLQAVLDYLDVHPGDHVFDGTLGGGGYTRALAHLVGLQGQVVATDQDKVAVERFRHHPLENVTVYHDAFTRLSHYVERYSLAAAVLDLGISSDQLRDGRGISFQDQEAPLDMRMDQSADKHLTAWGILNTWSAEEIADALFIYGNETRARVIAQSIVEQRSQGGMERVGDLVEAITRVIPRRGKIHPATQTFQALRILVNDELGQLEGFLCIIPEYMRERGRVVIVSFHSLEDRLVKQTFKAWKREERGDILTPKPLVAEREERGDNPRSRSAKLRAFIFT